MLFARHSSGCSNRSKKLSLFDRAVGALSAKAEIDCRQTRSSLNPRSLFGDPTRDVSSSESVLEAGLQLDGMILRSP